MELDDVQRAEVIERLTAKRPLSPEQERALREALREHRENSDAARLWSDIKASLLAKI